MTIYNTTNYRKIYEQHYGPIPKDEQGRSYEIHHIDGNRNNNSIENLQCVSLQEHYDIHYKQGDWMACHRIAKKLKLTGEEISRLAREAGLKRVRNGTHNFTKRADGSSFTGDRTKLGLNPLSGSNNPVYRLVAEGTHHFIGGKIQGEASRRRVSEGTHNLIGSNHNNQLLREGKHPSQMKKVCPHCKKEVNAPNYGRWHGNNCKYRA